MRKLETLSIFITLATVLVCGALLGHLLLANAGNGWLGWLLDGAAIALIAVVSVGAFSPNSPIFGAVISGRRTGDGIMALTFDDGPSPDTTPRILDILRDAHVHATFFVLGKHAERHPEIVARIHSEGHEVASHGWGHGLLVFARPSAFKRELHRTAELLIACGAPAPRLFRAPHGFRGPWVNRVADRLGYRVVGWSKGVFDTALPGANVIAQRSREAMRPGAILLLHDADGNGHGDRSQTADALPAIIESMQERGLEAVTVSELAARQEPPRFSWKRGLIGLGAVALVATLLFEKSSGGLTSTLAVLAGLNLGLIGLAVLANLVSIALKASLWKVCLETIPERPSVRFTHVLSAVFVGFLLNSVFVARAGEVARAVVLRRRITRQSGLQLPLGAVAGTIIAESLISAAILVSILVVAAFLVPGLPPVLARAIVALLLLVLAAAAVILVAASWTRRSTKTGARGRTPGRREQQVRDRISSLARDLGNGHRVMRHPGPAAVAILAGLGSWFANLAAIWLTLLAFGIGGHAFAAACLVFAVSNLVGIVQLTPGNLGVFPVAVAVTLAHGFGTDRALGISFGVGLQAIEVALGAGLGLLFLAAEGLSFADVRAASVRESGATPPRQPAPPDPSFALGE